MLSFSNCGCPEWTLRNSWTHNKIIFILYAFPSWIQTTTDTYANDVLKFRGYIGLPAIMCWFYVRRMLINLAAKTYLYQNRSFFSSKWNLLLCDSMYRFWPQLLFKKHAVGLHAVVNIGFLKFRYSVWYA